MSKTQIPPKCKNGVELTTLPWFSATALFENQWESIIDREGLNPSLHPQWITAIATSKGVVDEIHVLTAVQNNKLTTAVPYLTSRRRILGIPVTCLDLASNLVSYHAEIVSLSDPHEILDKLLNRSLPWHIFRAANLNPDGPTASALRTVSDQTGARLLSYPIESSPYLPIKSTWDTFFASKNKKFRYKYRRRRELFESNPDYSMRWFGQTDEIDALLGAILQIESRSWKARAGLDISSNSSEKIYYENLLPFLAGRRSLFANILYVNTRPIAYNLCCDWNGWIGQLKTSFDEEFKDLSPGSIVIDAAVHEAFQRGVHEFDFLGNADNHKRSWTQHTREHVDFFLFAPSIRSQFLGFLKALKKRT